MASKKKRIPPRPKSGSGPGAKRPGQPGQASRPGGQGAKGGGPGSAGQARPAAKPARERTGPTRAERLAAAETARRRKAARTRALIAGGLVAVLALLTITIIRSRNSNDRVVSDVEASGACTYDSRTDRDGGAGQNHLNGEVTYDVDPPAGGDHNPSPSSPGIFTVENKPPDARIVHSLEHGYVTIWHRPDLAAGLDQLRDLTGRYDRDVLLVPRASLPVPVAATAWHRRLLCERPDVEALERFVTAYRNQGPEKIPH